MSESPFRGAQFEQAFIQPSPLDEYFSADLDLDFSNHQGEGDCDMKHTVTRLPVSTGLFPFQESQTTTDQNSTTGNAQFLHLGASSLDSGSFYQTGVAPVNTSWQQPSPVGEEVPLAMDQTMPLQFLQNPVISARPGSVRQQFGQITPPNEDQSVELKSPQSQQGSANDSAAAGGFSKVERARNAAYQRHSRSKKNRKDTHQDDDDSNGGTDPLTGDKREKYREKNRVAAAKCRAKKKESVETLEDDYRHLQAQNSFRKHLVQDLREEMTALRTMALEHANCECEAIQKYNRDQAQALVYGGQSATRSLLTRPQSVAGSNFRRMGSSYHPGLGRQSPQVARRRKTSESWPSSVETPSVDTSLVEDQTEGLAASPLQD